MAMTRRMTTSGLLAAVAVLGLFNPALAQRDAPSPEARGAVKSVDATQRTITIAFAPQRGANAVVVPDETFSLAQDVEIVLGSSANLGRGGSPGRGGLYRAANLPDLTAGTTVLLVLNGDRTKVECIVAEEPSIRGMIQSVDPAAKTLTLAGADAGGVRGGGGREQPAPAQPTTFTFAPDVEIAVDDGRGRRFSIHEGQIADLAAGASVTLWLSLDKKQVRGVFAEGPTLLNTVKSTNPATRTLTLSLPQARGRDGGDGGPAEERIVAVADNATILVDDGKGRRLSIKEGQFTDIAPGLAVRLKLSPEQSRAMQVLVEGPTFSGSLKGVDASKGTITIAFPPRGRGEPGEEKTFIVAKDARIVSEGHVAPLANLNPQGNGSMIQVRLSLDQTQAQSIIAQTVVGR